METCRHQEMHLKDREKQENTHFFKKKNSDSNSEDTFLIPTGHEVPCQESKQYKIIMTGHGWAPRTGFPEAFCFPEKSQW